MAQQLVCSVATNFHHPVQVSKLPYLSLTQFSPFCTKIFFCYVFYAYSTVEYGGSDVKQKRKQEE
jgi:hypothetical protein